MYLTTSQLKQIVEEELQGLVNEHGSPTKLVSQILYRSIGSSPVPSDIASDPAYAARGNGLQEGEYNIRGQYLVYRQDGQLMTINLGAAEPQHWPLINDALRQAGWHENENAGIPTPEDFVGALEEKKGKAANPWAICTSSVGRKDKKKYERCVIKVKKKHKVKKD